MLQLISRLLSIIVHKMKTYIKSTYTTYFIKCKITRGGHTTVVRDSRLT
jgi:hypothetical protein